MALYTNFPAENPFHGGIIDTWGTGLHEDMDPVTRQKETLNADKLNRIELRIQRIERILNQAEHEFLYPSGSIATSGFAESVPASGNYYIRSRLDVQASGMNDLVQTLIDNGTIDPELISFYPYYVGDLS